MKINTSMMMKIEDMPRVTRQQFFDEFDSILERVDKEKIAFRIEDEKRNYVLCPASWIAIFYDSDLGLMINSAVRYSLGRRTYMPKTVHDFIIRNIGFIDTKTLAIIEKDIDDAFKMESEIYESEIWADLRTIVKSERETREKGEKKGIT